MIKVFIADDHAIFRDGLRLLLENAGDIMVAGEAENGHDAVKEVKRLLPDIVIMDIAMTGLNGIEATHQIHESCPSIKVLILSMYSTSEHISRALKAGAVGYLVKESAGRELVDAIHAVHHGHHYLSQKITDTAIDDYLFYKDVSEAKSLLEKLNQREREVLQMVVEGKTSIEIADLLFLSPKTIETYRSRIMQKLGINNIPGLVKFAIKHGITSVE